MLAPERTTACFTIRDFRRLLADFVKVVPGILRASSETMDLVTPFTELNLEHRLDSRFTVAVTGEMKAGKS